ncbi:hypothetical protein FACS1894137_07090 [Spirochaetia bacterium]|nr:hypothetical protein FACS1894137_07090 [Spirochaetia bacterium]
MTGNGGKDRKGGCGRTGLALRETASDGTPHALRKTPLALVGAGVAVPAGFLEEGGERLLEL